MSLVVNLPGYPVATLPSVATVAALRARSSLGLSEGDNVIVDAGSTPGDKGGGLFAWASGSTVDDDGSSTIKPSDRVGTQAGRWVSVIKTGDNSRLEEISFESPASSRVRSASGKANDVLSILDFIPEGLHSAIALGTSNTDVTTYFQEAFAYLNRVGYSGSIYIPHGIYRVTSLTIDYIVPAPIRIFGDGILSSVIRKLGPSTGPVLAVDATGVLDVYLQIENVSFDGGDVAEAAIKLTNCSRIKMDRVGADSAIVGMDLIGCLISDFTKCRTDANQIGFRTRKDDVFPNLLTINQHECRENSQFGFDIGDGESIRIVDTEILRCGATGNTATGGMIIRSTVGSEAGIGSITLENCYFELNYGVSLRVENNLALSLSVFSPAFFSSEGGRAAIIGNIRASTITDPKAAGVGDTFTIAAQNSMVMGGVVTSLNDTSVNRVRIGSSTAGDAVALAANKLIGFGSAGNEFYLASDADLVGGSATDTALYKYGGRLSVRFPTGSIPQAWEQNKVGFFQTAPVVKQGVPGAATDLASVVTLANGIRTALINYGLA